jgi:hypothetical protein
MRAGLLTLLILLVAVPAAHARGPGSLQDLSAKWGSQAMCSAGYDENMEFITETCRTINYCRMRMVRDRRGDLQLRIGRCVKQAPWSRGTRTG